MSSRRKGAPRKDGSARTGGLKNDSTAKSRAWPRRRACGWFSFVGNSGCASDVTEVLGAGGCDWLLGLTTLAWSNRATLYSASLSMTRREMLISAGSTLAWLSTNHAQTPAPMLKNMGGEPPGFGHRSRAGKFDILEHCRGLG